MRRNMAFAVVAFGLLLLAALPAAGEGVFGTRYALLEAGTVWPDDGSKTTVPVGAGVNLPFAGSFDAGLAYSFVTADHPYSAVSAVVAGVAFHAFEENEAGLFLAAVIGAQIRSQATDSSAGVSGGWEFPLSEHTALRPNVNVTWLFPDGGGDTVTVIGADLDFSWWFTERFLFELGAGYGVDVESAGDSDAGVASAQLGLGYAF